MELLLLGEALAPQLTGTLPGATPTLRDHSIFHQQQNKRCLSVPATLDCGQVSFHSCCCDLAVTWQSVECTPVFVEKARKHGSWQPLIAAAMAHFMNHLPRSALVALCFASVALLLSKTLKGHNEARWAR
jgi:hypothetical protein